MLLPVTKWHGFVCAASGGDHEEDEEERRRRKGQFGSSLKKKKKVKSLKHLFNNPCFSQKEVKPSPQFNGKDTEPSKGVIIKNKNVTHLLQLKANVHPRISGDY